MTRIEDGQEQSSLEYLGDHFPLVGAAFRDKLRPAVDSAGPLTSRERELVMLAAYTAARQPRAFRLHCMRAFDAGATPAEANHAVLMTLGASATLEMVVDALRWIDVTHHARLERSAVSQDVE
jgi:alkylhydroperoxidase/carboxymuconolactone decarboxylase family protein YurZ